MKNIYVLLLLFLFNISLMAKDDAYLLSKTTYEAITEVQKLIEEDRLDDAKKMLLKLENSSKIRKKLDKAYVLFFIGYFYNLANDSKNALAYFEDALALDSLPPEQIESTCMSLVQIYTNQENYTKAIFYIDRLINETSPMKVEYYVYKANAHLALKEYAEVIKNLDEAGKFSNEMKIEWIKTKFYCYYELQDYDKAIDNIKLLIELNPLSKEYWLQLSSLYSMENKLNYSLSVLEIAKIANLNLTENEILQIVSLLRHMSLPYKAANILEEKLVGKSIQKSEKNMEAIGDLYYEAKEFEKAIVWYKEAAKVSKHGKLYFKVAQLSDNAREYQEVVKNITLSMQKPDEEKLDEKLLLLAKAHYELGEIKESKQTFTEALKYPKSTKTARAWLAFINK